jgi:hypothetical protein
VELAVGRCDCIPHGILLKDCGTKKHERLLIVFIKEFMEECIRRATMAS